MTKKHLLWLLPLSLIVIIFAGWQWSLMADGKMHAFICDVGQGDGALIVTPSGKQILVDGGPNDSYLSCLSAHMPFLDRTIELMVMTHPQMDHMGSFPEVLRRYQVKSVLMTGVAYELKKYDEFLTLLRRENATVLYADPAKDINLGDGARLDILWPPPGLREKTVREVNDTAIVFKLEGRGKTMLFTGDIELPAETALLKTGQNLKSDFLKVAHHGSKTSSSTGFLLAVDPDLAVISLSSTNTYGHPSPSVIERFRQLQIPVRMTKDEGTIELTW